MRYHQDTRLKSDRKKIINSQGAKVSQIVFDKEITQQWHVKTNQPTQLLPFLLQRICLSRMCEFWHQMKFFYFQNYQQLMKNQYEQQNWARESNLLEDWEESVILVKVTPQRIQQSKKFIKTLWKITRQRMMNSINRIKQYSGIQDESSLQLEDQKLNSYMRFLKLQQNKRIDIAIEILDSLIEKNTKKKLLNGFLNIRQRFKSIKKLSGYKDRIKLQCFVDIVMRSIRRQNMDLVRRAFQDIELKAEFMKRKMRHQNKSTELTGKGMSGKKIQHQISERNREQQRDTVNKAKKRAQTPVHSHEKATNNLQTIRRQVIRNDNTETADNYRAKNSNTEILQKDSDIKSISSHEQIIQSQFYYDQGQNDQNSYKNEEQLKKNFKSQERERNFHLNQKQEIFQRNNGMRTKRGYQQQKRAHNLYSNNSKQLLQQSEEQNINYKKTARTPSRITQNFYRSQNLQSQPEINIKQKTKSQHYTSSKPKSTNYQHQLHIPITQRIQKHFYEEHYEDEYQEENNEDQQISQSTQNNIHQQICVIRNVSSTPQRKPDRYEKIPILSNNIDFKQFFLNSNKKSHSHKVQESIHSQTYYENKCCEGCQYCTKLKKINQMMSFLQKNKFQTQKTMFQTKIHEQFHQNMKISDQFTLRKNQDILISKTEQLHTMNKKNLNNQKKPNEELKLDSSKTSNNSKIQQQKKPQTPMSRKSHYSKDERPSTSGLKQIIKKGFTPSGQSLMKSSYSKVLSERKMFSRKPMY